MTEVDRREIVTGFATSQATATAIHERLYAVFQDGRTYATDLQPYTKNFDTASTWTRVEREPEGAEYIGTYPVPDSLARVA